MLKFKEIKELSKEELGKRVQTAQTELFEMKMKHTMGQLASPIELRFKRRDIAKLKTALAGKKQG